MKRKSNPKNRPSEFVKLFANILNYGLANHTHKRIIGVMNEKSNNAKNLDLEVNYEKCRKNCENSRKNQSNPMQRNRAINEIISKRDDFVRENIQRDVAQNSRLDFIALIGWLGAILLCLSPLFNLVVWCSLAIIGLSLLTIQAYINRVYNLLFLNIFSIITFSIKLIGITT
jgi:hypothetical protein